MTDKTAKYRLKKAHFDFEGCEVSYTTSEVGFAASEKNEAYLFKSMSTDKEFSDVDKSAEEDNTSEKQTKETDMSVELQEQITLLQKQLKAKDLTVEFAKYELSEEVQKTLIEATVEMEDYSSITKALDEMVSKVAEAKVTAEEAVNKALEAEKNPVEEAITKEKGNGGEPEEEIQKTHSQKVKEAIEAMKGAK